MRLSIASLRTWYVLAAFIEVAPHWRKLTLRTVL